MSSLSQLAVVVFCLSVFFTTLRSGCDASKSIGGRREDIKLNRDGGYDFLVAIHEDVKEDPELLGTLQVNINYKPSSIHI